MSPQQSEELKLGVPGFSWSDLYEPRKLQALHQMFMAELRALDPGLESRLAQYHSTHGEGLSPQDLSTVLVDAAPHVSRFVARLFGVEGQRDALLTEADRWAPLFRFKDQFVKRRALKRTGVVADEARDQRAKRVLVEGLGADDVTELRVATAVCALLDIEMALKPEVVAPDAQPMRETCDALRKRLGDDAPEESDVTWVGRVLADLEGWLIARKGLSPYKQWVSFKQPHNLDFEKLVPLRRPKAELPSLIMGEERHARFRDGFALTDRRGSAIEVASEVDYCLYCHDRDKDSCSKGLRDNKTRAIKPNPLKIPLNGCPLDEKISEAHFVKRSGDSLAALALITVDNPMCAGTGHRICNDCMKACVFQKQEPVNIPQIETGALTDVLSMPWGFEIYAFLARWNPLNARRPWALPYNGRNVLVVGLGPAGYTLCHHLLNEGFGVVGIDGLKIEPLADELLSAPIRDINKLFVELDEKPLMGFGGVAEYGITVRWDKNFLTVLYLMLARRAKARFFGGVRLGGTLTIEETWQKGFDHIAIAAGAGKPTLIELENNLIRGIRKASDFLMGLQLTGAYKRSTVANLLVRMPAVVIGGGLTAIDTATELRAYYVVQCEKMLDRYEALTREQGHDVVRAAYDKEELGILDELLSHGEALRNERALAKREARTPDFDGLLEAWGGVTLAYRKRLQDSPAYRLNHEEVTKALEEGIRIVENASPVAAIPDEYGAIRAVTFRMPEGNLIELPSRTLCVAAGTAPNTVYEKEYPGTFKLDKKGFFLAHAARGQGDGVVLSEGDGMFTSYLDKAGHTVSYYGDNHPTYAGSVVKAMASAKDGYPSVAALFADEIARAERDAAGDTAREQAWASFSARLSDELSAEVVVVNRLTPTIVEVVVRAPQAARKFKPGQFYRLQNFEKDALVLEGTTLSMEGLALTGAWTDPEKGLLSMIVLEMGASSNLCALLRPGQKVTVMGPTGAPTETPAKETVVLAGGGLGNAVLFSIGKELRAVGSKVIYFAGYKNPADVFKQEEIEAAADQIVWSSDVGPAIVPRRPQDRAIVGNVVQAMMAHATGELGEQVVNMRDAERVIAIGSDRMMAAVAHARRTSLSGFLKPDHIGIGSINSPMQCMMKEVCAQCLQKHVDPRTGKTTVVFTCFNQDHLLDHVDWKNLGDRLRQNTVQEKLSTQWLGRLLNKYKSELTRA